jgi:hypothetical protein
MASANVKLDYKELEKLQQRILQVGGEKELDKFLKSCAKGLAARLLTKVIKRTPVGQYPSGSGKTGGTLRRGWTGGQDMSNGSAYANSLKVTKTGSDYVIEIVNPVEYASYVEFGHRQTVGRFVPAIGKRLKQGWVEGKFMLTISEEEIRKSAPAILEKRLENYLKRCFK